MTAMTNMDERVAEYRVCGCIPGVLDGRKLQLALYVHTDRSLTGEVVLWPPAGGDSSEDSTVRIENGEAAPDFFVTENMAEACVVRFTLVHDIADLNSSKPQRKRKNGVHCVGRLSIHDGLRGKIRNSPTLFMLTPTSEGTRRIRNFLDGSTPHVTMREDLTESLMRSAEHPSIGFESLFVHFQGTMQDQGGSHDAQLTMQFLPHEELSGLLNFKNAEHQISGRWQGEHVTFSVVSDQGQMQFDGKRSGVDYSGCWKVIDQVAATGARNSGTFRFQVVGFDPRLVAVEEAGVDAAPLTTGLYRLSGGSCPAVCSRLDPVLLTLTLDEDGSLHGVWESKGWIPGVFEVAGTWKGVRLEFTTTGTDDAFNARAIGLLQNGVFRARYELLGPAGWRPQGFGYTQCLVLESPTPPQL